jgi:diguanylate cyclase (GGDEF)-like protein
LAEVYQWSIGIAGLAVGFYYLPGLSNIPIWILLYLFALAIMLEIMLVPLGKTLVSLVVALPIGVTICYGPAPAVWLMICAQLVGSPLSRSQARWTSTVFNAGQYALSAWAMAHVFHTLAPAFVFPRDAGHLFLSALAAAIVFFVVNHVLVHTCAFLLGRLSPSGVLESVRWEGLGYLITLPFDALMVALKPMNPLLAPITLLPILLLGQMLRMYRRMMLMQQVHQLTGRLASEFDVDRICEEAAQMATSLASADSAAIFTLDDQERILLPSAIYPMSTSTRYNLYGWREEHGGVVWQVLHEGGTVYIPDVAKDPRVRRDGNVPEDYRSMAIFPLRAHGHAHGVLICYASSTYAFGPMLEFVSTLAAQVAVLLENAKLYQELQEQSWRDAATGLYNYRFFYEALSVRLRDAREEGRPLSVAIVDVDLFKKFNDTYGHLAGDAVLRSVASLLCDVAGPDALVARYGGEEFGLIMPVGAAEALERLERMREAVSRHVVHYDGHRLQGLTISCGFATYPDHASNDRDLLLKADSAMYWGAKQRGRNRTAAYSPEFDAQLFVDDLTGLYTLHFINIRFREEFARGVREWGAICLDLDDFSRVNNTFGFEQGDKILKETSLILKESLRQNELACRYGGDEFFVLLPIHSQRELEMIAERLVRAITNHRFACGTHVTLTLHARYQTAMFTDLVDFTDLFDRVGEMFAQLHAQADANRA